MKTHAEYCREWRKNNKEKIKVYNQKKYQRIKNSIDYKFRKYQNNAKRKEISFEIIKEEFALFWKKSCSYCGSEIETIGLDRIDNKKGYLIDNITSCCSTCNAMKEQMTKEEFISQCKKIVNYN